MGEARWRTAESEIFDEDDRDDLELVAVTVDTKDYGIVRTLLEDPLELLKEHIEGVDDEWTVSFERVNAINVRPPRKLICVWLAIRPQRHVHGVFYRVPPDSQSS